MNEKLAVNISHLNITLDKHQILKDVSLQLYYGEIASLLGHNGSGKTMLLRCIAGFIPPQSGSISIAGQRVTQGSGFVKEIGFILDDAGFLPNYSGLQNLKYIASIRGITSLAEIRGYMESVGLDPDEKKTVAKYSQGMKKRLSIAQAIMEAPTVILLDEPMNGIDQDSVHVIYQLLLDLAHNHKCAVLITSHYPEDIRALCDSIYRMTEGTLSVLNPEEF